MCSGRVDPSYVMWGLASGFDAVLIVGCRLGDCHYSVGNYNAQRRVRLLRVFMEKIGVAPKRLHIEWVSSAEGNKFARLVEGLTGTLQSLGPLAVDERLRTRMKAAKLALEEENVRWLIGKEKSLVEEGNVFGKKLDQVDFDRVAVSAFENEFNRNLIALTLAGKAANVPEIAAATDIPEADISAYLVALEAAGKIALVESDEHLSKYVGNR